MRNEGFLIYVLYFLDKPHIYPSFMHNLQMLASQTERAYLVLVQAEGCLFLVFEFCDGGDLASYIRRHGTLPEQIAREFMYQLGKEDSTVSPIIHYRCVSLPRLENLIGTSFSGSGLRVLRRHHIVHRDLKPEVFLITQQWLDPHYT